jgi:hypothetical protein
VIALTCLMLDCIISTSLISSRGLALNWGYQCNMSMLVTVTFVFGTMAVIFLRMRRIYKVFILYEAYLLDQKNDLDSKQSTKAERIPSITSINQSLMGDVERVPRESEQIKK